MLRNDEQEEFEVYNQKLQARNSSRAVEWSREFPELFQSKRNQFSKG
jgi:hypothetical protein